MFNRLKKIIGVKELIKEQVGNYFYYGSCSWDSKNKINIVDSNRVETIFNINTYSTNSMKLELNSIKGKKVYHLQKLPDVNNEFLKLEVSDLDSGVKDIEVNLNESIALFKIPFNDNGFYFSKESPDAIKHLKDTSHKDINTQNLEAIIKIIDRNPFLKNEFGYNIEKMKECLMKPFEVEKYNDYKKNIENYSATVGYDIMNEVIKNELHYEDLRYLPYSEEDLEEFRKLHYRLGHYKSFQYAKDEKNVTLKYYLEIV